MASPGGGNKALEGAVSNDGPAPPIGRGRLARASFSAQSALALAPAEERGFSNLFVLSGPGGVDKNHEEPLPEVMPRPLLPDDAGQEKRSTI